MQRMWVDSSETFSCTYPQQVDALSELFVAWDDVLSNTESKIRKLDREKIENCKLGYE